MANADAHFEPKALGFLHDTSSAAPHRDSGNARALEKSGELQALGVTKVELLFCARDFAALHLAAVNLKEAEHLSDEELGEFRARVATAVRQECAK